MLHFYAAKVFRREADVPFVPDRQQLWNESALGLHQNDMYQERMVTL